MEGITAFEANSDSKSFLNYLSIAWYWDQSRGSHVTDESLSGVAFIKKGPL